MKTVHKFGPIKAMQPTSHVMSVTRKNLAAGYDRNGVICVWVEVYDGPDVMKTEVSYQVFGTGHEVPQHARYVATVFDPDHIHIWHVYEL